MILIHHTVFYVYLNIIVIYHCKLYMDYFWYYRKFDFLYFLGLLHPPHSLSDFFLSTDGSSALGLNFSFASFIKGVPYSKISFAYFQKYMQLFNKSAHNTGQSAHNTGRSDRKTWTAPTVILTVGRSDGSYSQISSVHGKSCSDSSPEKLFSRTEKIRPVSRPLRADPTVRPIRP